MQITGCQFIGHHLAARLSIVPHSYPKYISLYIHVLILVVRDVSLQVTAPPLEPAHLPHGVAVTSSQHQEDLPPFSYKPLRSRSGTGNLRSVRRAKLGKLLVSLVRPTLTPSLLRPCLLPVVVGIIARTSAPVRPKG